MSTIVSLVDKAQESDEDLIDRLVKWLKEDPTRIRRGMFLSKRGILIVDDTDLDEQIGTLETAKFSLMMTRVDVIDGDSDGRN